MGTMLPRFVCLGLVAVVMSAASASTAFADAPRTLFTYDGGSVKNTFADRWVERNFDGVFNFREVYRNVDYIELYDASRDCTVRIYANSFYVRFGQTPFSKFYDGRWNS